MLWNKVKCEEVIRDYILKAHEGVDFGFGHTSFHLACSDSQEEIVGGTEAEEWYKRNVGKEELEQYLVGVIQSDLSHLYTFDGADMRALAPQEMIV